MLCKQHRSTWAIVKMKRGFKKYKTAKANWERMLR